MKTKAGALALVPDRSAVMTGEYGGDHLCRNHEEPTPPQPPRPPQQLALVARVGVLGCGRRGSSSCSKTHSTCCWLACSRRGALGRLGHLEVEGRGDCPRASSSRTRKRTKVSPHDHDQLSHTGASGSIRDMTNATVRDCGLCSPDIADAQFHRLRLWEDPLWRLSAVLQGPIPGFAHLEPRRHIPYITDLDGAEAATLGGVIARVTAVLRQAAGADLTYVYIFGDHTPHLHFNLAPHREGDALRGGPGLLEPDAVEAGSQVHEQVAATARQQLAGFRSRSSA